MFLEHLCPPALLYVAFSLTQIIIDIFKNMYNTAFFKLIVTIIFTIALNTLCRQGLGIVSWFIVFVPFIMMSIITTLLLFAFGLSPSAGKLDYNVNYPGDNSQNNSNVDNNSYNQIRPIDTMESRHQKKYTLNVLKGSNYNPFEARAEAYEKTHPNALKMANEQHRSIQQEDLKKWRE